MCDKMFNAPVLRRTTLISIIICWFLIGLALPKLKPSYIVLAILYSLGAIFGFYVIKHRKQGILFFVCMVIALICGYWRGLAVLQKTEVYTNYIGRDVTLRMIAKEDAVYSERKQLIFTASNIRMVSPGSGEMIGNIEVEGFGVPMVYRGDEVEVQGRLFKKRGDNIAGVSFATISTVNKSNSFVDKTRREFAVGLQNTLPEPMASFALGLLIGQRNTLPETLKDQLVTVGLIHIVAVSGYNLTIIINFSKRLFERRSRYQALLISVSLIFLFLLLTGSSPSIIRAAVVSAIGLVMWYFGRDIKPVLLLLLAAALTAGANPLYLWSSIGWYLSFTAFFGVLVLTPLFLHRFVNVKLRDKLLPQILSETIAAQLCTLPIILFVFGRLSVISVVANILVVPVIPFAMIASVVAGVYGMAGPIVFGGVFVVLARLTLDYILSMTDVLSRIPYANVSFKVTAAQMAGLYILIISLCCLLSIQHKRLLAQQRNRNLL